MMKNIFLTGEIKVGKSTIINKVLLNSSLNVRGFKTIPVLNNGNLTGFTMESLNPDDTYPEPYIGKELNDGTWTSVPKTFEEYGVKILKESLIAQPDLILMDELGFFETKAPSFQQQVLNCLASSIPVLGVIKPIKTPFLNAVRSFPATVVLEINTENRNEKYVELLKLLKEVLQ
jgi:nucleoside-triphosphatase